jgi:hypothetical protein
MDVREGVWPRVWIRQGPRWAVGLIAFAYVLWRWLDGHNAWLMISVASALWLSIAYLLWSLREHRPRAAKHQPRPTVNPKPSASKALAIPVQRMRSKPYLEPQKLRHRDIPAPASFPDNQIFHYLIQIAECAVALHCEVTAGCESDARHHIK